MPKYTAKDVATLRQMTGAGVLDCRNALEEANGDLEEAAQILRLKGLAGAAKRSDREASEGAVAAVRSGDAAAVVELRCETDFVAKSDEFVALTDELAAVVAAKGEEAALYLDEEIERLRTTLKENISIGAGAPTGGRAPARWSATDLHQQAGHDVNAKAVVIEGSSYKLAHDIATCTSAFTKPT